MPAIELLPNPDRRRWPWLVVGAGLVLCAILMGVRRGPLRQAAAGAAQGTASASPAPALPAATAASLSSFGDGFVVWESRRDGAWRIWRQDLAGGPPRPISPAEAGRNHCCAQVSPDGARVAYLSVDAGIPYGEDDEPGRLQLIAADGSDPRVLVEDARTYGRGHRAALWHDDRRLAFLRDDRSAALVDVGTGAVTALAPPSDEAGGWLVNATRSHATTGVPTFSPYDSARRTVSPRTALGGCEPVFSHDGKFGIWVAGAGGPLYALDLASRSISILLEKNDQRLGGLGYMYFPSLARSGDVLAFGASAGEHDHTKGNYEVYLAEVNPATLAVIGRPVRVTDDPGSDRYPDVHVAPLALGRHTGEAPFTVTIDVQDPPATVSETYARPGSYSLEAQVEGRVLRGRVNVLPPAPPQPLAVAVRGGRELVVRFDEPVAATGATATLASGRAIASIEAKGNDLHLTLAAGAPDLDAADRLALSAVPDTAQRPNLLRAAELEVPAPTWPSDRRGLTLLWERADRPNLVPDPAGGGERTWALRPRGRARLDHGFAMALDGRGSFDAEPDTGAALAAAAKSSNEIGLELTIQPARLDQTGTIVSFARPRGEPNLLLEQRGPALVLRLLTKQTAEPEIELARLTPGRHHLALSYGPGDLRAWLDGQPTLSSAILQRDFFRWRDSPLRFGDGARLDTPWSGKLSTIAFYNRRLTDEEVAENHRRLSLARAPAVATLIVEARRSARSRTPTLAEIAPYREALAAHLYEITRVIEGPDPGPLVRVAHWVILDGENQPIANAQVGEQVRLTLEPFERNPQLQSTVMRDDLGNAKAPLYLDLR